MYEYRVIKPRFQYIPRSPLVRVIAGERVELRPRNSFNKIYVIDMDDLKTMRAVVIACQTLASQQWFSKELMLAFISAMMLTVSDAPTVRIN
ncbi:UNVERIFIED_CONTAM: hypothetical protein RF648_20770, partial [Kocuria sp. CPCC 205274]